MEDLKTLRERLNGLARGGVSELSALSGLSHTSICKIRDGKSENPGVLTVQRLSTALDKLDAELSASASSDS
jgi:transcriptional regulator with XRE-family HTH domain